MRTSVCLWTPALVIACVVAATAQTGVAVGGRLVNSLTGEPVPGATVVIDGPNRETRSGPDGSFTFDNIVPGEYHISVRADGFSQRRTEVVVAAVPLTITVPVDPEIHFADIVSVSPDARSPFESYQPTSVLSGQELTKDLEMSIGDTLQTQPGLAARSFGPAPSRPVIRGLDGDRVLILQDGQRLGDLSSQSGDHGVAINPAAAQRIEVVRGPATLLYGANAIGGLVNVITDEIPTEPQRGVSGNFTFDAGSAARQGAAAADLHAGNGSVALHAGGGGRRSGDVHTPGGTLTNSQSRSGFGNVGLSWTRERSYLGASYGYDNTRYGVPIVEDGRLQLTPRRHALTVRAGASQLTGLFDAFRTTAAHRRYQHEELEGDEIGTLFRNDTTELELMGSHRAAGRLKGSVGGWFLDRDFDARGAEALSPAVRQRGFAGFFYEELTWPHATFQFGGRVDHARFAPAGETGRRFTNASASVGLLLQPAAARDALTIAVSLARTARHPALEEMFFFGNHHGNFASGSRWMRRPSKRVRRNLPCDSVVGPSTTTTTGTAMQTPGCSSSSSSARTASCRGSRLIPTCT
jgi:iron complex outermembrane recepter protein